MSQYQFQLLYEWILHDQSIPVSYSDCLLCMADEPLDHFSPLHEESQSVWIFQYSVPAPGSSEKCLCHGYVPENE